MKVILLDNVKGIGRIGDVKEVNDGYARNFLFPRKLGRPADAGSVKDAQARMAQKREAAHMATEQARALAEKLNGTMIVMHGKANEKGTLFSGIPRSAVAQRISESAGAHIREDAITSDDHLKTLGSHTVHIRFSDGITANVTVDIQRP